MVAHPTGERLRFFLLPVFLCGQSSPRLPPWSFSSPAKRKTRRGGPWGLPRAGLMSPGRRRWGLNLVGELVLRDRKLLQTVGKLGGAAAGSLLPAELTSLAQTVPLMVFLR